MATPMPGLEHSYSKHGPEHNYSKYREDHATKGDVIQNSGQIKTSSIQLYFKGLKSVVKEDREISQFLEDGPGSWKPQLSNSDQTPQFSNSDKTPQFSNSDQTPQFSNSDKTPQLSNSDQTPQLSNSDKTPQLSNSDKTPQLSNSDETPQLSNSDQTAQFSNPDQTPTQNSNGRMEAWDAGDLAESERLYAVELKTYSTVGGIWTPMMVTVLNVAAMTLKCIECKAPFKKQLESESRSCLESHICGSSTSEVQPPARLDPGQAAKTSSLIKTDQKRGPSVPDDGARKNLSSSGKKGQETAERRSLYVRKARGRSLLSSKVLREPEVVENHPADIMVDDNDSDDDNDDNDRCETTGKDENGKLEASFEQKHMKPEYLDLPRYSQERREKYICVLCEYNVKHRCSKLWKKEHKCSICDKIFRLKSSLDQHVSIHTGEKPHKCPTCGKGFRLPHSLIEHSLIHGGEKKFLCHICGRKFLRPGDQRAHIRRHLNQYPNHCAHCNKGFKGKRQFEEHTRKHTGEKPFLCPICGQTFRKDMCFRDHVQQHEISDNPLRCIECDTIYQDIDELRLHTCMRGKQRLCFVCGKTFVHPARLKHHMKIHIRSKPSTCKSCQEEFVNELELRMHQDEHIVKCSDCGETIKEARSCMLDNLPGSDRLKKVKKFKCWSCHSNPKVNPECQDKQNHDVPMNSE